MTGFTLEIVHLDGHKVSVSRDKVTWAGARVRKKGEGMPNFENNNLHGNLYVTFDIEFPKKDFSDEEKEGNEYFIHTIKIVKCHFQFSVFYFIICIGYAY